MEIIDLDKCEADEMRCGLNGSPTIVSKTWKIGVVGGNCKMHQGKAAAELVSEVFKDAVMLKEFVKI